MTIPIPDHLKDLPEISADEIRKMTGGMGVVFERKVVRSDALEALHGAIFQGVSVELTDCLIDGDLDFTKCEPKAFGDVKGLPIELWGELRERGIEKAVLIRGRLEITGSFIRGKVLAGFPERSISIVFSKLSFSNSNLGSKLNFRGVTFVSGAVFSETKFGDDACFDDAAFGDVANFRDAAFGLRARFEGASFGPRADFFSARLGDRATFARATFGDLASFELATFGPGALFVHATFRGAAVFRGLGRRGGEEHVPVFNGEVAFRWVTFDAPDKVIFQRVNLQKALFLETPLEKVQFIDVEEFWPLREGRKCVYDEITERQKEKNYALIARLYRQLKKNYEEQRAYAEAGDFHYGEMEMMLKQQGQEWKEESKKWPKLKKRFAWFLTRSYKFLSGYGETPGWALGVAAGIWLIPAVIYFLVTLATLSPLDFVAILKVLFDSLGENLQAMTFRLPEFKGVHLAKKPLILLQALLGPIQIALAALALRRKFRR